MAVIFKPLCHFLILLAFIATALLDIHLTDGRQLKADKEIRTGLESNVRKAVELDHHDQKEMKQSSDHHPRDEIGVMKGNSPGVGHSFPGYVKDGQLPNMPEFGSGTAQTKTFKQPDGHSPGVGHSLGTAVGPQA